MLARHLAGFPDLDSLGHESIGTIKIRVEINEDLLSHFVSMYKLLHARQLVELEWGVKKKEVSECSSRDFGDTREFFTPKSSVVNFDLRGIFWKLANFGYITTGSNYESKENSTFAGCSCIDHRINIFFSKKSSGRTSVYLGDELIEYIQRVWRVGDVWFLPSGEQVVIRVDGGESSAQIAKMYPKIHTVAINGEDETFGISTS